jgi:hypothetical protein
MNTDEWTRLLAAHSAALDEFVMTSRRVPSNLWKQPLGPGKWTPAEIASHLTESYQILRRELKGAPGMQLRLGPLKRWLLRRTLFPRILATGNFPAGARAPRETRPTNPNSDPVSALQQLTAQAEGFARELSDRARLGQVRLTHAYFGGMSARQSLALVTVHTRHHARQLATVASS